MQRIAKVLKLKRARPEEPAGSSSKSAKPMALEPCTADAEERHRTAQWCKEQPLIVASFVRRVTEPHERMCGLRRVALCTSSR